MRFWLIDLGKLTDQMQLGDSVAVNGVCLTVTRLIAFSREFSMLSHETLKKSSIGTLRSNSKVNLERALQVGARLGGHIVQGHVDGLGKITSIEKKPSVYPHRFSS